MITLWEDIRAMERAQRARSTASAARDKFKKFYQSREWHRARYAFLKKQPRPLRCACCCASADDGAKIVVDHVVPLRKDWFRRTDQTNFALLCNECNFFGKGGRDDDFRTVEVKA